MSGKRKKRATRVDYIERIQELKNLSGRTWRELAKSLFPKQKQPYRYLRLILSGKRGISKKLRQKINRRYYYYKNKAKPKTMAVVYWGKWNYQGKKDKAHDYHVEFYVIAPEGKKEEFIRAVQFFVDIAAQNGHDYLQYANDVGLEPAEIASCDEIGIAGIYTDKPYPEFKKWWGLALAKNGFKVKSVMFKEV